MLKLKENERPATYNVTTNLQKLYEQSILLKLSKLIEILIDIVTHTADTKIVIPAAQQN